MDTNLVTVYPMTSDFVYFWWNPQNPFLSGRQNLAKTTPAYRSSYTFFVQRIPWTSRNMQSQFPQPSIIYPESVNQQRTKPFWGFQMRSFQCRQWRKCEPRRRSLEINAVWWTGFTYQVQVRANSCDPKRSVQCIIKNRCSNHFLNSGMKVRTQRFLVDYSQHSWI